MSNLRSSLSIVVISLAIISCKQETQFNKMEFQESSSVDSVSAKRILTPLPQESSPGENRMDDDSLTDSAPTSMVSEGEDFGDYEDDINWSDDFSGCHVQVEITRSTTAAKGAGLQIIVGDKEKLKNKLKLIDAQAYEQLELAKKSLSAAKDIRKTIQNEDVLEAYSDNSSFSATKFTGKRGIFHSEGSFDLNVTKLESDLVVISARERAKVRVTKSDVSNFVILIEREQRDSKVCTRVTSIEELEIDIKAPAHGKTFVVSKATGWNGVDVSFNLEGGVSSKHSIIGTSIKNTKLVSSVAADGDNFINLKFTSLDQSQLSFNFGGSFGQMSLKGTAARDSSIEVKNSTFYKTEILESKFNPYTDLMSEGENYSIF